MKKLLLLLAAFVSLGSAAKAQNNGFLGRHFMLGYNLQVMPRTFLLRDLRDLDQRPYISLSHQVNASGIINRYTSAQVFYSYGNYTALKYTKEGHIEHAPISCVTNTIGGGFYFYMKKHSSPLAPVGSYLKLALSQSSYTIRDEAGLFDYDDYFTPADHIAEEFKGNCTQLSFGKGRTRIIKERVVVDYGADFTMILQRSLEHSSGSDDFNFSRYERAVAVGLQANMFTIHLGVGGLLF